MLRGYAPFFTALFVGGYPGSRRGSWFRANGREAELSAEEFR